jgi:uncharacterized protein
MSVMSPKQPAPQAWWREPMMWLVVGGPAVVVVAGIATLVIAASQPDPVLARDYYQRMSESNSTETLPEALRPAGQARNHAATPVSTDKP